jgi:hypothetical protein
LEGLGDLVSDRGIRFRELAQRCGLLHEPHWRLHRITVELQSPSCENLQDAVGLVLFGDEAWLLDDDEGAFGYMTATSTACFAAPTRTQETPQTTTWRTSSAFRSIRPSKMAENGRSLDALNVATRVSCKPRTIRTRNWGSFASVAERNGDRVHFSPVTDAAPWLLRMRWRCVRSVFPIKCAVTTESAIQALSTFRGLHPTRCSSLPSSNRVNQGLLVEGPRCLLVSSVGLTSTGQPHIFENRRTRKGTVGSNPSSSAPPAPFRGAFG